MRMRKKKNLLPRMERCGALWVKDPSACRGAWRDKMPGCTQLRLELGCGKGRFTCETAARHPDVLFVAVERVPDAMVIAMERAMAMGLSNVLFIDGDAAVLSDYFAPGEVDLIYINFCDPWPGNKHVRRRLTHPEMLMGYRAVLRDGGEIHFKTDNHDLYEWSLFQFPKAGYRLSEVTRDLHRDGVWGVMTDYEEKFHSMGTPINRCVGTKEPLAQVSFAQGLERELPEWTVEERPGEPEGDLPPRARREQVRRLALRRGDEPPILLDYLEGYPGGGFAWVLSLDGEDGAARQETAAALPRAGAWAGLRAVRLACSPAERESWQALGFSPLRPAEGTQPEWTVMEYQM